MTEDEFRKLRRGDMVRSPTNFAYTITRRSGGRVFANREIEIDDFTAWHFLGTRRDPEPDNRSSAAIERFCRKIAQHFVTEMLPQSPTESRGPIVNTLTVLLLERYDAGLEAGGKSQ